MTALDTTTLFRQEFERAKERERRFTPIPESQWHCTGRATRAYPDKENEAWWLEHGPGMVDSYVEWRRRYGLEIWETPDNRPAIELDLRTPPLSKDNIPGYIGPELPGLRAIIDRVFVTKNGEPVVVDLKTGQRRPVRQLGFYKVALELVFDVEVVLGAFFKGRDGKMTELLSLSYYTPLVVANLIKDYEAVRATGIRTPIPSNMCTSCTVRDYCAEFGGKKADEVPPF
jgi:hypothetical protein